MYASLTESSLNLIADMYKSRWVILKESARSSFWFTLLHTSQTSDMNAITSRAVFSAYPKHMMKKISFSNNIVGDSTSAALHMNERQEIQEIQEIGSDNLLMTPCGTDCPSLLRASIDLEGFGQFVHCPSREPPMPNPQYIWSRDDMCCNQRCDNYEISRNFSKMPNPPHDLYLTKDMNGMFFQQYVEALIPNLCPVRLAAAQRMPENTDSTIRELFQKHLHYFLENVCKVYHLDTAAQLLNALRLANAVIGGSCALYVFCPTPIWPQNLDFFLPRQENLTNALHNFLLVHGYCLLLKIIQDETTPFSDIVDHCDTYIHSKTERIIRVVYANSASPLGPLLDAHSTLVMNYISWNSAVCIYPATTLQRIGIRLQRHNIAVKAFKKYVQRGFIMRPQLHRLVPESLYKLSVVDGGASLILGFNGHPTQFEEVSWILPSNKAGQGRVIIIEDGFGESLDQP